MARLQAQANLEYIPTQDRIRPLIRSYLSFMGTSNCLDPCCGPGDALVEICSGQNLYGVEIHTGRALEAKKKFKTLAGPIEKATISNNAFSFCHCNPPYDWVAGGGERYEEIFLYRTTRYLCMKGVLEFLVPITLFQFKDVATRVYKHLIENYRDIQILKYPEPEFSMHKQIVIFGVKKPRVPVATSPEWLDKQIGRIAQARLPELSHQENPLYNVPISPMMVKTFRMSHYDSELAASETCTVDVLKSRSKPVLKESLTAPYYLDKALLALLAVGGYIDGAMPGHFLSGRYENKEEKTSEIDPDTGDEIFITRKVSSTVFYVLQKDPGPDGSRIIEIR